MFLEEFQKLPSKGKELAVQDWTDTITGWSHFIGWIKVLKKMPIMNKARRHHLMLLLKMKVKRQPQQKSIIYHSKYNLMRVHCLLTRHLFLNQDLNLETWERQLRLDPQNTSCIWKMITEHIVILNGFISEFRILEKVKHIGSILWT